MLFGNGMIHATYTALYERPEAFNRVGMGIAAYVNLFGVVDSFVMVSSLTKKVVNLIGVCVDRRLRHDALDDVRPNRSAFHVLYSDSNHFSAALNHSEDWLVVRVAARSSDFASLASASTSADIGFVHFDWRGTVKGFYVFGHEFVSNLVGDSPRGLVGHAKLALKLLRGYPATSACHQIHGIEPQMQGRRGLVKDGSRSRGQMLSASLTRPSLTLLRVLVTLELALRFALWTMCDFAIVRVAIAPQELKASVVVGELFHKLHERVLGVRRFGPFGLFSVYWWHSETMLHYFAYSVKG